MTFDQIALFLPAAALVAASPGANNLLSLTHGIKVGFGRTVGSLIGRFSAVALMIVGVAFGLGPVLETSETFFLVAKWLGVAYLAYLGIKLCRSRELNIEGADGSSEPVGVYPLAKREFLVAVTNPKAPLLFTAFLPQFIRGDTGFAQQMIALGAIYIAVEFCAACGYAFTGTLVRTIEITPRRAVAINRATGGMMLGAAALLATTKRA